MTDAQGVPARMNRLALKEVGTGRKNTSANTNRGKIISFPAQIRYTKGLVKSFLKSMVARRIPKISIQMGVVILPRSEIASFTRLGMKSEPCRIYKGRATKNDKVAGFMIADLTEIYFLSVVRQ